MHRMHVHIIFQHANQHPSKDPITRLISSLYHVMLVLGAGSTVVIAIIFDATNVIANASSLVLITSSNICVMLDLASFN